MNPPIEHRTSMTPLSHSESSTLESIPSVCEPNAPNSLSNSSSNRASSSLLSTTSSRHTPLESPVNSNEYQLPRINYEPASATPIEHKFRFSRTKNLAEEQHAQTIQPEFHQEHYHEHFEQQYELDSKPHNHNPSLTAIIENLIPNAQKQLYLYHGQVVRSLAGTERTYARAKLRAKTASTESKEATKNLKIVLSTEAQLAKEVRELEKNKFKKAFFPTRTSDDIARLRHRLAAVSSEVLVAKTKASQLRKKARDEQTRVDVVKCDVLMLKASENARQQILADAHLLYQQQQLQHLQLQQQRYQQQQQPNPEQNLDWRVQMEQLQHLSSGMNMSAKGVQMRAYSHLQPSSFSKVDTNCPDEHVLMQSIPWL